MRFVQCVIVTLCLTGVVTAQTTPAQPTRLPVRRVVLYKAGVGYFAHVGRVPSNGDVVIQFTSAQLDDVLKSLTTVDLNGGRITGIRYNSVAPIGERLRTVRAGLAEEATALQVLRALRGARVEVQAAGGAASGRLLSVEQKARKRDGESRDVVEITVLTGAGTLRTFEVTPALGIRITETDLQDELDRYLSIIGSARERDVRRMTISTAGSGARQVLVSYVSEVPIWKTNYRLILPAKAGSRGVLQGWAIVDNTIGEDWDGVELSLVAGSPQSFIQNISQPYYGHRPVVPLPRGVSQAPQTHAPTLMPLTETVTVTADAIRQRGTGGGAFRPGGAPGGVVGGVVGPLPPPAAAITEAITVQQPGATGGELGDLFEYRISDPVTIRKNESALVPIVRAQVDLQKVSLWNRGRTSGRPLRAVWLTNTSGLTLDGGSFSVLDDDAFAGEGLLTQIQPGERRLLSYASDQAVLVSATQKSAPARIVRVRADRGVIIQQSTLHEETLYTIRNEDDEARAVVVEHPTRDGWNVRGDVNAAETAPGMSRFRVDVPARRTATLTVQETRPEEHRVAIAELADDYVMVLVRGGLPAEGVAQALQPILTKKREIAEAGRAIAAHESDVEAIERDQQRVRENMKALKESREERALLERYARQLMTQEDRVEGLKRELNDLQGRRAKLEAEFAALMTQLSFDIYSPNP
jgi:hypothetical protein